MTVVVTNCQDRPDEVRLCLDGVVRSSYRNIEIMVMTDHVSRSIAKVVRSYARWDPRIKPMTQPTPSSLTWASTSPNGQCVLVVEAPDRLEKGAVAGLVKVLRLTESDFALGQVFDQSHQPGSVNTDLSPPGTDRLGLTVATGQPSRVADRMTGTLFRSEFLADLGWTVEAAGTIDQGDLMDRAYRSGRFDLVTQRVVMRADGNTARVQSGRKATTITTTSADS